MVIKNKSAQNLYWLEMKSMPETISMCTWFCTTTISSRVMLQFDQCDVMEKLYYLKLEKMSTRI